MSRQPPEIFSVLDAPLGEGNACRRLVLASSLDELEGLDPREPGLAIFLTDWLTWIEWRERGGRAFHQDCFLQEWPSELGDEAHLQQRSVVWMYENGVDVTVFDGVSLGKQFNWEITGVFLAAGRMAAALKRAIDQLKPENIEYRGLRCEYDFLDRMSLANLAQDVAAAANVSYSCKAHPPAKALHPELPFNGEFTPPPFWKMQLLNGAVFVIDMMSRIVGLFRARTPKIFILHNLLVVKSLIKHLPNGAARPVLLARLHPKRAAFLASAWNKGCRLLALPSVKLDETSLRKIGTIRESIRKLSLRLPSGIQERAVRHFLEHYLLPEGTLEAKALEVAQYRLFLGREKPSRILVGDSENHLSRLVCEIAQSMGIAVDELPNGMFLTEQRMDNRSGDGFRGPVIDRYLAWGSAGSRWVAKADVAVPSIEVGYPVAESLAETPAQRASSQARALILPLHVDKTDMRGLYSEVFSNLVIAVRAAARAGYKEIRVKVHPGFFNLDYYMQLNERFDLRCDVIKDGPLLPHIVWADVVVGPLNSGAMIEAAALGRTYIPLLNEPTAVLPECAAPATPILPRELEALLARGLPPDNSRLLLDKIAGVQPGGGVGRKVWDALLNPVGLANVNRAPLIAADYA